jgi:hypothetical protein
MIPIEFSWAIFLFGLLPVLFIFWLWIVPFTDKSTIRNVELNQATWHCNICTYIYIVFDKKVISKCPRCGSLNKRSESPAD